VGDYEKNLLSFYIIYQIMNGLFFMEGENLTTEDVCHYIQAISEYGNVF
jgi:hypothetical protein